MRSVMLKTIMAGPDGVYHPGKHRLPKNEAHRLVAGGLAEYADNPPPAAADPLPAETAIVSAPKQRAKGSRK